MVEFKKMARIACGDPCRTELMSAQFVQGFLVAVGV
jgi:hypothetical protein